MAHVAARFRPFRTANGGLIAALCAAFMLAACAQTSDLVPGPLASLSTDEADAGASSDPMAELRKATEYWGKEYADRPSDKTAALSYAKNLKAMGDKRQALAVLQEASVLHSRDAEVASEFGRLALEFDQLSVASRALEVADQPGAPDWRVISARGTLLAKQGQHKAAIPYFQRALSVSPNQPSVMNNLAMAYTMDGQAARGEELLRKAREAGADPRIGRNLDLVVSLQGKEQTETISPIPANATVTATPLQPAVAVAPFAKATATRTAPAQTAAGKPMDPDAVIRAALAAEEAKTRR